MFKAKIELADVPAVKFAGLSFRQGFGRVTVWVAGTMLFASGASHGEVFPMPPAGSDLIGEVRYTKSRHEDTLVDIARAFSVGQDEMVMANPNVDRWMPGDGTKVVVPRRFILPDAPRNGIVINIPEMRLFYYPAKVSTKTVTVPASGKGKNKTPAKTKTVSVSGPATEVVTYPVSIGRMEWRTPLGATRVVQKVKDPVWIPPETIKREHAKDGDMLPDVVPAGPNNPLGAFAMKLGVPGYLIHGTDVNKSYGIGMRVTHGCIRMYPEDIAKLFPTVSEGTQVYLVNQPIKLGWVGDTLYVEVQQPLDEDTISTDQLLQEARSKVAKLAATRQFVLDDAALRAAVEKPSGIPVPITRNAPPMEAIPETDMPVVPAERPTIPVEALPEPAPAYESPDSVPSASETPSNPSEPVYPPQSLPPPEEPVYPPSSPPSAEPVYPPPSSPAPEEPIYPQDNQGRGPDSAPVYPDETREPIDSGTRGAVPAYPAEPIPESYEAPRDEQPATVEPTPVYPEGNGDTYPNQVEPAPVYPDEPAPRYPN